MLRNGGRFSLEWVAGIGPESVAGLERKTQHIEETDAAQFFGIILLGIEATERNNLIATKADGFVDWVGIEALEAEVFLGSCDEECGILLDAVEPGEVHIAAIHDVD